MRFKWKISLALLLAGLVPMAVVMKIDIDRLASLSETTASDEIQTSTELRGAAIERYFDDLVDLGIGLAQMPEKVKVLAELDEAADELGLPGAVEPDMAALEARYALQQENTPGATEADRARWMEGMDPVGLALQHLYIGQNRAEVGQKQMLNDARDGSRYSQMHAELHPTYRDFMERHGFYDILFAEPHEGRVIYSVYKEVDFGTSMTTGPYASTALGKAVQTMIKSQGQEPYLVTDFEAYEPSYGAQAFFLVVPVKERRTLVGVLIFQLPIDFGTEILAPGEHERKTLDAFILGSDGRVRSAPRFAEGIDLAAPVPGAIAAEAAAGERGATAAPDHRGVEVVAAYRPLEIPGLDWSILTMVERSEVMAVSEAAMQSAIQTGIGVAVAVVLAGLILSAWLLRPIKRLGSEFQSRTSEVVETLRTAAVQARGAAETMAATAEETSRQTSHVKEGSELTAADVSGVAAAVEQLSSSINEVVAGIQETNALAGDAAMRAEDAAQLLAELEKVAGRITGIVTLINDVARQTNLLALNAAVEASHAGAAGRGFAVVASEIRKLAARTTESTHEITGEVRSVLSAVKRNSEAMRAIAASIGQVNDQARGIASAATQQGEVTHDIAERMSRTAGRVGQSNESLTEVQTASENANRAAGDVLGGVVSVERAAEAMDAALAQFLRRVQTI
ncbi:methyl-accepting chemotaxis protein [Tabrizicola sp. TH137]|uniref:methyl-accepting chemotaxis protein n=1 Tax=Tabrizicola sp. TH137 TaxID=2067452 RepID=UPI000C7A40EC|nr:methyl-accepting chemotaxis protein [Tabrizicola sp. TH137]PLL10170.1 methyl-accepting chemotaxis protein [Tabrizicola sp. TH137]